jgi:CheY-like chemotaxis protein/predicted regulator of Ras-like GTPase activity (Roadblock/LC7/MglB family)
MTTQRAPRRVLLVDDEEALVWSLASRLAKVRPGDKFETANDGTSALALMSESAVDLLVADIRMPGMSGIDLVLTARGACPELPVVLMTAFKTAEVQRLSSGPFTGLLEKPFGFERLVELMDEALMPAQVGFSGAISVQTLPDIVQLYALSSTTGLLTVRHGNDVSEIWFEQGQIRHAVAAGTRGDEAVYATMMWSGGAFSMRVGSVAQERSVRSSWQELLMESCRRIDERLRGESPPSRTGWTQSPPPPDDADLGSLVPELPPQSSPASPLASPTQPSVQSREVTMNIKDSLAKLTSIDGFVGAAVVDSDSGMLLGQEGGGPINLEVAAASNTEVVRAKRKAMANLAIKDAIEDILISLGKQYHLIRPLRSRGAVFFYVVLDRSRANLAMARLTVADVERDVQV